MHHKKTFYWPAKEDTCWVPFSNLLKIVNFPTATSHSRTYQFSDSDFKAIGKLLE